MKKLLCILSLFALLLASCSKSSSPTSTNTNNNNNTTTAPQDSMIVTVDGVNYRWYAAGTSLNGSVSVQGYDAFGRNVTVNLANITQQGTYDVGVYTGTGSSRTGVSMTSQYKNAAGQVVSYYSPVTGGAVGKVTVEEITSTTCKATFYGTLTIFASVAGAPPTTVITNGSVNAKLVP